MKEKPVVSKPIITEHGETEFQARIISHLGIGLLTSRSDKSYLVLDCIDPWFDIIQGGYPPKKKCGCKHQWFNVRFDYINRTEHEDFGEVKIFFVCTNCSKTSRGISVEIDYSPTDHLLSHPITYCKNPYLKHEFAELVCYWKPHDLTMFLDYMFHTLRLNVYCEFWRHPEYIRRFEKITFEKAIQIITINHEHFGLQFSAEEIDTESMIYLKNEKGVFTKGNIWRRNEIIELSPTGYYIRYCNQYLDKGVIKHKSRSFEDITTTMRNWLGETFIKRGSSQFISKEFDNRQS